MATDKFVLDDSMAAGWEFTKKRFWSFLGILGLTLFILFLPGLAEIGLAFTGSQGEPFKMLAKGLQVASSILGIVMGLGIINVQLRIVKDLPFNSNDLWTPLGKFWAYLGVSILYTLMVGFGLVFLIVPGIILGLTFMYAPYFVVNNRCGPIQALKASAAITEGAKWELFFLMLVLSILEGLSWVFGLFTFFITTILGHMFAKLTMTYVFLQLIEKTPASELPFATARGSLNSSSDAGTSSDTGHNLDSPHSPGDPPTPKF